jgi:hypothetical protein
VVSFMCRSLVESSNEDEKGVSVDVDATPVRECFDGGGGIAKQSFSRPSLLLLSSDAAFAAESLSALLLPDFVILTNSLKM